MSFTFEEGKDQIIDSVVDHIKSKLSGSQARQCAQFVKRFFSTAAVEDLKEWSIDDLYGAALSFWKMMAVREPHQTKIRIYNPDYERHGWQTTHTVIEIVSDDMPFLVDSVRMVVRRMGFFSHLIIHKGNLFIKRNKEGQLTGFYEKDSKSIPADAKPEAAVFIEIDRQTDAAVLEEMHRNFERVLEDNRVVCEDWAKMRQMVNEAVTELNEVSSFAEEDEVEETKAFLNWIEDHHFTFLGIRDYELIKKGKETILQSIPETGLGVLRKDLTKSTARSVSAMTPEARELTLSSRILVMSKTNTQASVHRDAYTDYIGIKRFNKKGQVIGERRIIGLYTSAAYNTNPRHIPFLRHKVAQVMEKSNLELRSHAGKILLNILETLPRDDLIQASVEELLEISMGIFYMQERRKIRLFARQDVYRRFISALVFVPRELFNTELRQEMQDILMESFNAKEASFSTRFSESVLARIHFIFRIDPAECPDYDIKEIERKLVEVGRSWSDELKFYLLEAFGEEKSNHLFSEYKKAFPTEYSEHFSPRTAVYDIKHINELSDEHPLSMNFYRPMHEDASVFRLKVYQHETTIALSDVLPILESLGLRALSERPYKLKFTNGKITWINDFSMQYPDGEGFNIDEIKDLFQNAFANIWFGHAENDQFNKLVLRAGLDWRQVSILRVYAKYFKQIGIPFSQDYIESALNNNHAIARKLVRLFELRFNPELETKNSAKQFTDLVAEVQNDLESVSNRDEDKIIRQYCQTISSTLRTNFYQVNEDGSFKDSISLKLNSKTIPMVPRPHPEFEIFCYSPRFEAVHLRGGKIARGGLRWSDRRDDFRFEVSDLRKAQQVKNAIIVPYGAKGGFVTKKIPASANREEIFAEGVRCYQSFIRGLLDITDNLKDGKVIHPERMRFHDEDDPYLVVAADKGTATFSDIANSIAIEYGFWLGDAFASGGSIGYDHKKMGITARGGWESVKRHFYEMGIDINTTDFTVVGVGDMSGDVFGNGMLLSKHIKLVAAFNHQHIFLDPDPNPSSSYKERKRLFDLPRSSWEDYDKKLISKGGGVFNRSAKSITLSNEVKKLLDIKQSTVEPAELIRYILKAKVDLFWSGGIGTYVKSKEESNADVADRANDYTRINGDELRCRCVGEGGNLGMTQRGRTEYALNGGLAYTDFIDNSAGVNCSDKEVNIKILLNTIVDNGDLTFKQRNQLLADMTDDVAQLVLRDNFVQTRSISHIATQASRQIEMHSRYINELERSGLIDRELEFLPEEKILIERKLAGQGLTRPEIAVLLCYSKMILKEQILKTDVPEDEYTKRFLYESFPPLLREKFSKQMQNHPLRREIIATKISNLIMNEMGFTFIYRLQDETGAPVSAIVRAYLITRSILNLDDIWKKIEGLESKISAEKEAEMVQLYIRLARRVTRWFLRTRRTFDISGSIDLYAAGIKELKGSLPKNFPEIYKKRYDRHYDEHINCGVSKELAHELAITRGLFSAMDIIDIAEQRKASVSKVAELFFHIGESLDLTWVRKQVIIHPTENHWESLSREALRDDLDWQQRQLTAGIIDHNGKNDTYLQRFDCWTQEFTPLIKRWRSILSDLRSTHSLNFTMFFVAIRELADLTQTTLQVVKERN